MLVGLLLALLGAATAADAVNVPRTTVGNAISPSHTTTTLANAPYKDPSLSVSKRVANLVSLMTIEEKVAQLQQGDVSNWLNTTSGEFNQTGLEVNFAQKAGQFYVGYPITWEELATNVKRGQDYAVNSTRLGIPAIVQTEGIHGFLIGNATIFNSPIGQACSWNRSQISAMARQIGNEAKTLGVSQVFAPLADLARELRYGRVEETYGEDGYLAGEMAMSYVQAVQETNVSAMVKHYAAYSQPEQGLNTGPVHLGERELRTTWLPSYQKAIVDGGAWAVMSAYSSLDGVPQVGDYFTLTEVLRNEWGFKYWVSSDAGATDRLANAFYVCPVPLGTYGQNITAGNECITLATLPNGGDVEMGGGSFNYRSIPELVQSGQLHESVVDTAVSRLLTAKFEMGLFEHPYTIPDSSEFGNTINNDYAKQLARELDADSIVLLKNEKIILPISKSAKVAVIGPMADGFINYGDYVVYESQYRGVSPLEGIQAAIGNHSVTYAQGCERWSLDQSGFPEAITAAKGADVAVVVVGTWSRDQDELWEGLNATTGEHVDVDSFDLVGAMGPLVEAIINTTVPTVVVFSSGKPITATWLDNTTASLVQQFYPSEEGGNALADILFGDVNPSGKLSVSFPRSVGDLPVYYDYLRSGRYVSPGYIGGDGYIYFGHQYVLGNPTPWFEFGFGLSYTTFEYTNMVLSQYKATASETIKVSVDVANSGTVDGAEVVQLYVRDVLASVDVPNIKLQGFDKVYIPAGATRTVSMDLDVEKLGLWNRAMEYVVEPGEFLVFVGASSMDLRLNATLSVT
ncbi:hypothetical protein HWV62_7541 [Athelia sp. TMB]|nr:hypothetical protein HWV62_7541 [Athelia sp. TMB]